jgi:prepilin-type N-terminal cleavage/methylation domain-containing protein
VPLRAAVPILIRSGVDFYSTIAEPLLHLPISRIDNRAMADSQLSSGSCRKRPSGDRRRGASLIELLVVIFIIGIMLSLLLPALSGARGKANEVKCVNNMRQVSMALSRAISSMRKFPLRNRWTIEALRYMEEEPLYDALKNNTNPNADFGRPPLYFCPFQEDFPSRVPTVGFCHFVLVVDRPEDAWLDRRPHKKVMWDVMDRRLLAEDPQRPQQPWYIGPEISYIGRMTMLANEPGPHPDGRYMTDRGQLVP